MPSRSPARYAAPLALVTVTVAFIAIIGSGNRAANVSQHVAPPIPPPVLQQQPARATPRSYVVKAGDVLAAIAQRTGVAVGEIERLNPTVEAWDLQPGQKLRLGR
jgi:LysM repeat protein